MPKFLLAYHGGGMPETEEEGAKAMALWQAWFEKDGPAFVDGGNPVGLSKTVNASGVADDGGANPVSGYSIIQADDMANALSIAEGCPMVVDGSGSCEVAEIVEIG